jgi:YYY domain-containing protein
MGNTVSTGRAPATRSRLAWLAALVLLAATVRFIGLDFDQRHHFHPDERAIADAVGRLSFDPAHLQLNPKFFAYGSFPLYVDGIVTSTVANIPGLRGYDERILVGRGISAVVGTLTVLLLALLGARLYNFQVGLLAGALLAACVLHVQNSHFMTTDVFLTLVVLVALYLLIGLVRRGRTRDYVYSGLAIGLAAATKFSALPLLAPLGVAILFRLFVERRFAAVAGKGVVALLAVAAGFALGQPYAILDFATFSRQITEQSNMVRHAGLLPYTNQYIGVPKYLYEIEQIVLWCMGPALGLAALWATARQTVGAARDRSGAQLVLLSWVIPYFLVTGWFEVKFVRYLLPIYPIVILWAAAWLWEKAQRSRLGRVALWTVVGMTVAQMLAFLSIYQRPHTVVTASDWVYRNVPAGSTLLTQHWDEGFPFRLPHRPPHDLKVVQLPYYEGERKMGFITEQLAEADYLAFQTKRLYGAITRAPQKYPLTNNYFYLLFAGDLGYTLVYDHASRPSLFGFELPDELADESITVYDHPKVLIFKNTGHLSAGEILEKVRRGIPSKKLDRTDLLLAQAAEGGAVEGGRESPLVRSSGLALLWFAILIEVLGLSAYAILYRWLPVTGCYALSKVLGILFFAYAPWLVVSLEQLEFTRGTLLATAGLLVLLGFLARRRWLRAPQRSEWAATEALFWGVFLFFLVIRAFNPEIFWGEKPMDFSFLNALYRSPHLPPPEPWFAGSPLYYTYFGHYVVAALGKACHIHPGITFNLGIALFGALTATAAFTLGCAISERWRVGLLAAALVGVLGNLAGLREIVHRQVMNFDYFWATSRVIKNTINEYPVWSFLFADLHAHVLVMPFSLTFLALAVWWVRRHDVMRPIHSAPLFLLLGLTLGAIMVTNGWSSPTYVLFFPFLLGCVYLARGRVSLRRTLAAVALLALLLLSLLLPSLFRDLGPQLSARLPELGRALLPVLPKLEVLIGLLALLVFLPGAVIPAVGVVALAYVFFLPFWANFTPPPRNWGFEREHFANFYDFANIFGLFLFIAVPFLFALWRRTLLPAGRERVGLARALAMWIVGLTVAACCALSLPIVQRSLPPGLEVKGTLRIGLAILSLLALNVSLFRSVSMTRRIAAVMFAFAFAITAGTDIVYVWDRMNTLFKFYLETWFLFGGACAVAVFHLWRGLIRSRPLRHAWQAGLVVLLALALFTTGSGVYAVVTLKRVPGPRPTLDGTQYLVQRDPHERAAYEWLNDNIEGIPVIAEAYGPSYQDFARVSMNTGLPTVLGWDYHVHQRAHDWPDINRRKADLKLLYTSDKESVVKEILQKYHVALVYVGRLERREYSGGNLDRFKSWSDLLEPVYQNAGVTIFAVHGQFTGAMPITTIEEVPRVEERGEEVAVQTQPGSLRQPRGLAIDAQGDVYVADFGNDRIQKYDRNLDFVLGWGDHGNLPGQFKQPGDVAIGPGGNVYVADTWNQRVQVFTPDGKYLREWGGSFYGPRGITVAADGTVYLADTGNHRVRRFDAEGHDEGSWGGLGSAPGQFKEPVGIATDANGDVYVCDNGNGRMQIFDRNGKRLGQFAVPGWESKVFSEPHVAIAPDGTIWVTVPLRRAVRAYDRKGNLLEELRGSKEPGGLFRRPMGIGWRKEPREIVVTNLENSLVRVPLPKPGH